MASLSLSDTPMFDVDSEEAFAARFNLILNSSRRDSLMEKMRGFFDKVTFQDLWHDIVTAEFPESDYYTEQRDKFNDIMEQCISDYINYNSYVVDSANAFSYLESPLAYEFYQMFICQMYKMMYNRLIEQGMDEYHVLELVSHWVVLASRMKDSAHTETLMDSILDLFTSVEEAGMNWEESEVLLQLKSKESVKLVKEALPL